jgi:hypothetical protein
MGILENEFSYAKGIVNFSQIYQIRKADLIYWRILKRKQNKPK